MRCTFDTPFQRALPPTARLSSGHSWPHFGHLFIGFSDLADCNNLGRLDRPVTDQLDQDAFAVYLPQDEAEVLLPSLRLFALHDGIDFHVNIRRASSYQVNRPVQKNSQQLELVRYQ